jgi:hypothetical protein
MMKGRTMLRGRLVLLSLAASLIVSTMASEPAEATVEHRRPCFGGVTVSYGDPLRDMPPIRHVENAGMFQLGGYDLGFAPLVTIVVGPERLDFRLAGSRSRDGLAPAPIRLTAKLIVIAKSGEPLERHAVLHRLVKPRSKFREEFEFGFDVPRRPSFYRVDITLRAANGQRQRFSEYFRVVKEKPSKLRGRVSPRTVPQGGRLEWLIENPGTDWMWPSTEFPIERLVDGQWIAAGPPGLLVEPQNILPGGLSFGCRYTLPSSLEPGQYRLEVSARIGGKLVQLLLPFGVVPGAMPPP